jgi:hypothetical protein
MVGPHRILILDNCRQPRLPGPVNFNSQKVIGRGRTQLCVLTMPGSNTKPPSRGLIGLGSLKTRSPALFLSFCALGRKPVRFLSQGALTRKF